MANSIYNFQIVCGSFKRFDPVQVVKLDLRGRPVDGQPNHKVIVATPWTKKTLARNGALGKKFDPEDGTITTV